MKPGSLSIAQLTRRERQIMDVLFQHREASVAEVIRHMPDPPGYSAVRALLRLMERKGYVSHFEQGPKYIYKPAIAPESARRSAVRRLLETFFNGSAEHAVAALLDQAACELSDEQCARLVALIEQHRQGDA